MKKQHLKIEKLTLNKKTVAQLEQSKISGGNTDPHINFDSFVHYSCDRIRCESYVTKVACGNNI